jgi:hypothetical protein
MCATDNNMLLTTAKARRDLTDERNAGRWADWNSFADDRVGCDPI